MGDDLSHPCPGIIKCEHTACIGESCIFHPSRYQAALQQQAPQYRMKVRCPVCNGTGTVEPAFQSSIVSVPGQSYMHSQSGKVCPACNGTGMQEVTVTVP